ncbi:MAG: AAA family ATPase [Lysobacterales bacterium]|jgi:general secretion pathway protein A
MYLRFFGLDEAPFSITPDPAFVYLSQRHRDALAHLLYGVGAGGAGGFVQLTGEVGTGKTTLCRCLLEQIPDGTRIALLLNPLVTPQELLAAISEELGIDTGESLGSTRLLVDGLNRFLLAAHARGERVVVVIDEAQNLSPEALEQVRLLTNLETSKEKLLQIVLLGQPELRELLQRRDLRQLAQRITARFHLSPLGPKDTHLYIRHRMRIAGAQRNPFRRSAMNALYQRSQGIPRLINIIADRALAAAYVKERADVTAAMVHAAANEVQLGEHQVRRNRWPWLAAAATAAVLVVLVAWVSVSDWRAPVMEEAASAEVAVEAAEILEQSAPVAVDTMQPVAPLEPPPAELGASWLASHQADVWQGMAEAWGDPGSAFAVQAACNGDNSRGYACLHDRGSWSKIKRLDLPVVLVLQAQEPSYLHVRGLAKDRLLVGTDAERLTVSRESVDALWLGGYLVVWPQAPGWPPEISRGARGPAVQTIVDMASRVAMPYHGERVFDDVFESWLKGFQARNGLQADGIVGRNTLLHLMTASIEEPRLLDSWE